MFASIFSVLRGLKEDGYNVDGLPDTAEGLIEDIIHDKEAKFNSPDLNIAYRMPVREYERLTPYAKSLEVYLVSLVDKLSQPRAYPLCFGVSQPWQKYLPDQSPLFVNCRRK